MGPISQAARLGGEPMKSIIEPDATIEDVVPTLTTPKEYVRAIVSTMVPCFQKHGNATVRIGITGEGKMPFHKISFVGKDGKVEVFGAYSGESVFQDVKIHENTWSTSSMTYDEVRELLGKLRGWKGPKA